MTWVEKRGLELAALQPFHVSGYVEKVLMPRYAKTTVKQHLAAIRMLCNFLVVRQVIPRSPAEGVRGPSHSVTTGKTPALAPADVRDLFAVLEKDYSPAGLRDRALMSVQLYSFGRVSAVIGLDVDDYYLVGKAHMLRLLEKGGKKHRLFCDLEVEPGSRRR